MRFKRILASFLVGLTAVIGLAQPAQANGIGGSTGCDDVGAGDMRICLYQWERNQTGGGFWQRRFGQIGTTCQNLENHTWNVGVNLKVNNTATSMAITAGNGGSHDYRVRFYDWVNCASAGGYSDFILYADGDWGIAKSLENFAWANKPGHLNNTVGSVQILAMT